MSQNIYLHPACTGPRLCRSVERETGLRARIVGNVVALLDEQPISNERHGNEGRLKVPHDRRQYLGSDGPGVAA
jgi:hypothetical protein